MGELNLCSLDRHIGSIGHVGENGPKFSKEWVGKNIFKLEFSQPIKSLLDMFRKYY